MLSTYQYTDLVNDEALREEVETFLKEKKYNNDTVHISVEKIGHNTEEHKRESPMEVKDVHNLITTEIAAVSAESEISELNIVNTDNVIATGSVTLAIMKRRNIEFDQCMSPVEKASKELRFGAQLELLLEFKIDHANCLMCREHLKSEFIILKHIQLKHKEEHTQLKTVLETSNMNTLNMFLHKAIRSEFLYQQKHVFPVHVPY